MGTLRSSHRQRKSVCDNWKVSTEKKPQIRGVNLERAVLAATLAQIEAVGIEQTRIAEIAARAGVHETSIYRRWKTLPRLLADALIIHIDADIPIPDTGSLREDLMSLARGLAQFLETPHGDALMRGTVQVSDDPEVAEARREFWNRRLTAVEAIVQRALVRGEVRPGVDARTVVLTLGGYVHLWVAHLGETADDLALDELVDLIIDGVSAGR